MECQDCTDPDDWAAWGCGWHDLAGKGQHEFSLSGGEEPYTRTCPQFYRRLPWVQEVLQDLEDYRRGALGNVLLLPAPWLALLRAADVEASAWKNEQEMQLLERRG
jgi:hypothetical protein